MSNSGKRKWEALLDVPQDTSAEQFEARKARKASLGAHNGDGACGEWLQTAGLDEEVGWHRRSEVDNEAVDIRVTSEAGRAFDDENCLDAAVSTPELCARAIGSEANVEAAKTGAPLFPLFRPTLQRKVLIVIRHGESQHNALSRQNPHWSDPKVYDPQLTPRGAAQALQLRKHLAEELQRHCPACPAAAATDVLWVASPLRRAIETFLLSCPLIPESALAGGAGASVDHHVNAKLRALRQNNPVPLKIVSVIAEQVKTYGDIGTCASQLREMFQPLQECFALDKEYWWHGGDRNCKESDRFEVKEHDSDLKARVAAAKRWLEGQPQKVVIMYGHSIFWKTFFARSLRNCEYVVLHW